VPQHFVDAVYGTASNAAGTHINFGLFLKGDDHELEPDSELYELVPGATRQTTVAGSTEGTVDAWSFILVTSADRGTAFGSRRYGEEAAMEESIYYEVHLLAPKAAANEGG
jgi:non-ribosomal peptide synthetase component F